MRTNSHPGDQDSLRTAAEARLAETRPATTFVRSAEELLHELRVNQIELEMQNEALRESQITLEESRDRYIDFYDFSPVGYLTLSREALITEINLTGATLLGEDRRKLLRHRFDRFVAPLDSDRWHQYFMAVLQHTSKQTCELEIRRGDGSRLHLRLDSLRLVKVGNSPVVRIVLTDITERKSAETALLESEKRQHFLEQQKIVQASLDGFWMVNAKNGQILEVNDIFCNMIGYSREEILSMRIQDLDVIDTPGEIEARIKRIREIGYDRFETRHRHKQGHLVDFEVSISHSEINGGINFAFFHNITERKKAEAFNQSILNSVAAEIAVLDHDGVILAVNQPWRKFALENGNEFGKPVPSTDVGTNYLAVCQSAANFATDGALESYNGIRAVLDGRLTNFHFEYPCHSPQQQRWFSMSVMPLGDTPRNGVVVSHSDITDRKKMETEILARRNEMEYLQKKKLAAQTAAAIAHELNQPLLAIATYSKAALMLLKAEKPNLEKIQKAIDGCERQSHRAGQSIRELLDLLSMKEFPTEAFDINKEILDVLNAAKADHELQFDSILRLEEQLPFVRANRIHIQKVLFNLLHNGIDAMQEAGVPLPAITVTVRTMKDESVAQVTIQDNGPGVKKENLHRLFEPFFTTKAKGIGMGLAISRSLVEENGGQLWIDPQEGSGAIFHLTLPFAT